MTSVESLYQYLLLFLLMIPRPPRSPHLYSSAASDGYKSHPCFISPLDSCVHYNVCAKSMRCCCCCCYAADVAATAAAADAAPAAMTKVVRREGVAALWKGNLVTILHRIPYSSINFYTYEYTNRLLQRNAVLPPGADFARTLASGALAGFVACTAVRVACVVWAEGPLLHCCIAL